MKFKLSKLLFVHPYYGQGGAEKGIYILASYLSSHYIKTDLFCLDSPKTDNHVFRCVFESRKARVILTIFEFISLIQCQHYELVVINQSFCIGFYGCIFRIARSLGVIPKATKLAFFERLYSETFILNAPILLRPLYRYMHTFGIKAADIVISNSLEQLAIFRESSHFLANSLHYVPNSSQRTTDSSLDNNNLSTNTSQYPRSIKILWLARLESIKDPILPLKVLGCLPNEYILTICGHGSMLNLITEYITRHRLSARVAVVGQIDSVATFDIFMSTSYYEGLPNTFIEALSHGIPIVTTTFKTGLLELYIPFWVYMCERCEHSIAENVQLATSKHHSDIRRTASVPQLIRQHYSEKSMTNAFSSAIEQIGFLL